MEHFNIDDEVYYKGIPYIISHIDHLHNYTLINYELRKLKFDIEPHEVMSKSAMRNEKIKKLLK